MPQSRRVSVISGVDCAKDGRLANALAQAISAETEVLRSIEFSLNVWCSFSPQGRGSHANYYKVQREGFHNGNCQ